MASRFKEDEKNERIIRGLLKRPANRKCINCNSLLELQKVGISQGLSSASLGSGFSSATTSLSFGMGGPQYVCTTFSTFVCTTCSGIHREFTHRVKSVSMAKFTSEEVSSLQSGGNEHAKEIFFKELDLHRLPDSSNVDKLRDFIKHVYVNRKYTGERSNDRPPRAKMGEREEPNEFRKTDSSRSGSRSPPYEDTYERRYNDRPSPGYEGRKSPGYDLDNRRNNDYGRSPVRSGTGVVNDWRREDRFGNGRRSEDLRSSEGDSKSGGRSPDSQKDLNASSPPVVRPVREILGENAAPLRVIEPPRLSAGKRVEVSAHTQRTASSSSLASSNGNPSEIRREDSLINFDDEPEPPAIVAAQPTQPETSLGSSASSDNWACFDSAPVSKVSQPQPSMNPLDSMLTQLSAPSPVPASGAPTFGDVPAVSPSNSTTAPASMFDSLFAPATQVSPAASNGTVSGFSAPPNNTAMPTSGAGASDGNFSAFPSTGGAPQLPPQMTSAFPANGGAGQWSNMEPKHESVFPGSSGGQGVSAHAPSGTAAQPVEAKASGRKELPADIFAAMYAPQPVHAPGWMPGFAPGMAYPMQYNNAMSMPTYPQSAKSMNPFDVGGGPSPAQAPTFPSMMPLQAALPNMANPSGLGRTSSLDTVTPSWVPSQALPYPSATPQLTPYPTHAMPAGAYMNQQVPSNLAPRPQGFGGFGNDAAGFNDLGGLSAPASSNPSGNPFG